MAWQVVGTSLRPEVQRECLARFVHRYTRDHIPQWAREGTPGSRSYRVQFASDADWLAHTVFYVTRAGELDKRYSHCLSVPTWPDGRP